MHTLYRKTGLLLLGLLLSLPLSSLAQTPAQRVLQGAVFKAGSLAALQGVSIRNTRSQQTILSDREGIFSIPVLPGDTLFLQQTNQQRQIYVVPTTTNGQGIGLLQIMPASQPSLEEPPTGYPSQYQFERSVLGESTNPLNYPVSNLDENLNTVTADPTNMQKYIDDYMRWQQMYVLPNRGATNNFINPERWRTFIRDWKAGRFSQDAMEKLDGFPADAKDDN